MTLVGLIVVLCVVGLILWLINTYLPLDARIKTLLNVAVIIIVCIWLLQTTGLLGPLDQVRVH